MKVFNKNNKKDIRNINDDLYNNSYELKQLFEVYVENDIKLDDGITIEDKDATEEELIEHLTKTNEIKINDYRTGLNIIEQKSGDGIYDIVYFVKENKDNDDFELRMSLRSLKNLGGVKNVYIIGYKPDWLTNVLHIDFDDNANSNKSKNTGEKIRMLPKINRLSENFVYMMDDIYVLNKIDIRNLGFYKWGSTKDCVEHIGQSNSTFSIYLDNLNKEFPESDCFDTHTPIRYNKEKLFELLKKYGNETKMSERSLYCIENGNKGKFLSNTPDYKLKENKNLIDCKCYDISKFKVNEKQLFLSSSDEIIKEKEFKEFLSNKFPEKSKYEKD